MGGDILYWYGPTYNDSYQWHALTAFSNYGIMTSPWSLTVTRPDRPLNFLITVFTRSTSEEPAMVVVYEFPLLEPQHLNIAITLYPAVIDATVPTGLAAGPGGRTYVAGVHGINSYTDYVLTNSFNAPAELSFGSQGPMLSFGADNVLYAFDNDNNRVLRFSAEGSYLNSYDVAADGRSFGVSASGQLFVATGSEDHIHDGFIYDAVTGASLGSFDLPEDWDPGLTTLSIGSLTFIDDQLFVINPNGTHIYSFDISGVSAIPEPSTYAAILGSSALGLALWRVRRTGGKAA